MVVGGSGAEVFLQFLNIPLAYIGLRRLRRLLPSTVATVRNIACLYNMLQAGQAFVVCSGCHYVHYPSKDEQWGRTFCEFVKFPDQVSAAQ